MKQFDTISDLDLLQAAADKISEEREILGKKKRTTPEMMTESEIKREAELSAQLKEINYRIMDYDSLYEALISGATTNALELANELDIAPKDFQVIEQQMKTMKIIWEINVHVFSDTTASSYTKGIYLHSAAQVPENTCHFFDNGTAFYQYYLDSRQLARTCVKQLELGAEVPLDAQDCVLFLEAVMGSEAQ